MANLPDKNRLHVLCNNGKLKQIKDLLASDPNATKLINEPAGVFGFTPLHEAVSSRNADILRVLLTYGGQVDALSNGRYTPLHIAASIGDVECIRVLLDFSANLSLTDEFGKNPYATAELNRRSKAARVLKTAEIKKLAMNNNPQLRSAIDGLQRGKAVEEKCFEEALELAVENDCGKAVGYLVLHGARNVEQCMQAALLKPALYKTAVLLLLCYAAKTDDKQLVTYICSDLKENKNSLYDENCECVFIRKFLPSEWKYSMTGHKLSELRKAARNVDMAFPVAIAFTLNHFQVSKIILFETYCKEDEGEADWHGLALSQVLPEWIQEKLHYKKLILSHNLLTAVPKNINQMENLLRLDLSKNNILEVPKEIFELSHLRNLNLSSNEINVIPRVDGWSKAMKVLNLNENNLRFLDNSISQSELESLSIADNNLSRVQSCICKIKTLQSLDISRNKNITILPPDLAKLPKLNYLGIKQMDQITDPPLALRATTSLLLRHLKARLRSSVEYYTMKLMIVGLANRGKTTLMHRINKDFAFKENTSTKGVDIRDIVIQKATFKCWDFAGQGEYYATHQCFLSQRSLYMLVWNLLDGENGISGLRPWLANLQFRVPNSSVIIVGTHLDKVMERPGFNEERIADKVYAMVKNYKEIHCQREMIIAVTCCIERPHLDECRRRMEKLRTLIYNVASQLTVDGQVNSPKVLGEMIPSSYLTLSRMVTEKQAELNREGRLPLLRKCHFENMVAENATKHPSDYFDPEDAELATRFLHDIGLILHYNDPNQDLRDLYFISPSWLCDLMAKIVTVKEAHNFIRDGILREEDIKHIIKDRNFPQEFYPKYLRLLARFQIACRIDKERILVPSRLPENIPANIPPLKVPKQTIIRLHHFSCIPHGFWSRFISRFLLYLNDMLNVTSHQSRENDESVENEGEQVEDDDTEWCEEKWEKESNAWKESPVPNGTEESPSPESPSPESDKKSSIAQEPSQPATEKEDNEVNVNTGKVDASFLINGVRLEDNEESCRASSASFWQDSREATPISVGDSSVYSQASPTSWDQSRTSSSQDFQNSHGQKSENEGSVSSTSSISSEDSRSQQGASYGATFHEQQWESYDPEDDHFFEAVDISTLIDRKQLICWRYGVIFNHPKLFLSVMLKEDVDDRWIVETKVCKSLLGYRALAFTVDHIRTLIKEWFPGLEGTDGFNPYVQQLAPCPVCISCGINPPYQFEVTECLKESFNKEFLLCDSNHIPRVVELSVLCPDLLFMDLEPSMQVARNDLMFLEADDNLLGQGQFGKVYRGAYKDNLAAVKLFNFKVEINPDLVEGLDHFYEVRQEAVVLSRVGRHPYIITFYGVSVRPKLCLAIELATRGTLKDVLRHPYHVIDRIVIYRIAQQTASAISYLHSMGIIHRDLKSDNVLLFSLEPDSDINIKLADFGTANFISPVGLKFFTGTPGFIAPEIFEYSKTEEYDSKVDVFSYAMVLYELISRRRPFYDCDSAIEVNNALKEGKRPRFYNIDNTKYSLLTLTELMIKTWAQEAVKRPSSLDITRQLKSPSFCLLYGKTPLRDVNTPRLLCCIKSRGELWITCDDKAGASILIVNIETTDIKQKFVPENKCLAKAKESFFNISSIYEIDKEHVAIILRSTSDYVSVYSSERRKLVSSFPFPNNYIRSLAVHRSFVIIGREDGAFERVDKKDFLRGKWKDRAMVTVNAKRTISAVTTSEIETQEGSGLLAKLLLGCDKYVYKYPLIFDVPSEVKLEGMRHGNEKNHVSQMNVSEDGRLLFVACSGSSVVSIYMVETLGVVGDVDCAKEIQKLKPGSDCYDQRVTCFCVNFDTLWIGTGSGHILIYEVYDDRDPSLITWLKPYKLEIRSLVSCPNLGRNPSRFIVTIGKEVNPSALCYGENGLCLLTGAMPVDQCDPSFARKSSSTSDKRRTVNKHLGEFDKQMLLIWDGVKAAVLKQVVGVN